MKSIVFLTILFALVSSSSAAGPTKRSLRGVKRQLQAANNGANVVSICVGTDCQYQTQPPAQEATVPTGTGKGKSQNGKGKGTISTTPGNGAQEANVPGELPVWTCPPGDVAQFRPAFKGAAATWACWTPP